MSQSGGQPEGIPPVFKSPSKRGGHLSTYCNRDERLSRHCAASEKKLEAWGSVIRCHWALCSPLGKKIL
ncbi:hypothetical protein TNCV_876861 [Trichonephila clavipes]|nr:hypothetical protein TNCV_876861 [Trichonephila clavipes]